MAFSVKATKQHGMEDKRWTVADKIVGYKGLIRLYERDAKILQYDRQVAERKIKKQLNYIKKDIVKSKEQMNGVIKNDQCRELVIGRRTLQHGSPMKQIEYLEYINFKRRKEIDRLQCEMRKKSGVLISLRLELSQLEDNLNHPPKLLPVEETSHTISGKVADTEIKLGAALGIRHTYKEILKVLNKDKLYFDSVLDHLKSDCVSQSHCLITVTEIGQMAVEYTDDRKYELQVLERAVKRDMKSRIAQIRVIQERVKELDLTVKSLPRKDSEDQLAYYHHPVTTEEDSKIQDDIKMLSDMLQNIQEFTYTTTFEDILLYLKKQKYLKEKLLQIHQKKMQEKKKLIKKLMHAKSVLSRLRSADETTTVDFQRKEEELSKQSVNFHGKRNKIKQFIQMKLQRMATSRTKLIHIHRLCENVSKAVEIKKEEKASGVLKNLKKVKSVIYAPDDAEADVNVIFNDLEVQLTNLIDAFDKIPRSSLSTNLEGIEKCYQKFICKTTHNISYGPDERHDLLLIETSPRDPKVFTREQIKTESRFICQANAPPEWER